MVARPGLESSILEHGVVRPSSFDRRRRRITRVGALGIWIGAPAVIVIWKVGLAGAWLFLPCAIIGVGMPLIQQTCQRAVRRVDDEEHAFQTASAERIRKGGHESFALYLRPFWSDHVIREAPTHMHDPINPQSMYDEDGEVAIEKPLTLACARRNLIVVKLGRTMKDAARRTAASVDGGSAWFDEFCGLARRADLVFAVPAANDGIVREIEWLKGEGTLGNAVIVLPPAHLIEIAAEVDKMHLAMQRLGLQMPGVEGMGAVFRWNDQGVPVPLQRVARWSPSAVSWAIGRVLNQPEWTVSPLWLKVVLLPLTVPIDLLRFWVQFSLQLMRGWWERQRGYAPLPLTIALSPLALVIAVVMAGVLSCIEVCRQLVALDD